MHRNWIKTVGFFGLVCLGAVAAKAATAAETQKEAAELFQKGYSLVLDEKYPEGVQTLQEVINRFPKSGWVDDSRFWLCYAEARQKPGSEDAFGCFENFVKQYPRSKFANDAQAQMIEIGQELARQGKAEYADKVRDMREDQDEAVTLLALKALADIGDQQSLETILSLYSPQQSEELRVWIVRILEDFESPQARDRLMQIARTDPSVEVRSRAVRSLGDKPWDDEIRTFMMDLARSDDQPYEVRRRAVQAMGDTDDPQWLPFLSEIAVGEDADLGRRALGAIEDIGGPQAMEALKKIYQSSAAADTRRRALRLIAEEGSAQALELLEQAALEAPDEDTRRTAVLAIGEIESPQAVQSLSRMASESRDATIRRYALRALEETESEEALGAIAKALREDPDPDVRRQAARSLGELKSDQAVEALKQAALTDSHPDVQRSAVRALAEIGTAAARQALVEIAKK